MDLKLFKIIPEMGLNWILFRIYYEFKKRSGILKRKFPPIGWEDIKILEITNYDSKEELISSWQEDSNFIINTDRLQDISSYLKSLSQEDKNKIIEIADKATEGKILAFHKWYADYDYPINWHLNPVENKKAPRNTHWIDIEELGSDFGDVKYIWEASRFTHFFYFIRAYLLTNDDKYAKAYWEQIEHWMENNPPEKGINWKCSQEITFRTFAWLFGLFAFESSKHSTENRIINLLKAINYNIKHVDKNYEFALKAVKNNHAISEAAGMFVIGLVFPFFENSKSWFERGKKHLEKQGIKQIYKDGTYMQYSMNYHRLVVQIYSFVLSLSVKSNINFSKKLKGRLDKSTDFLYQMQDLNTGRVPNYGSNDGALLFPFSSCDYLNYKPMINTLYYLLTGNKLYNSGKHEEELIWFCGAESLKSQVKDKKQKSTLFPEGGYSVLRNSDSFAMIRCNSYKDRPGHADLLHLDLWWGNNNILCDIGTFSYNPPDKFKNYFNQTKNHNTIIVDGSNQLKKGPRFINYDWPEAKIECFVESVHYNYFQGIHNAYNDIIHRRGIYNIKNFYLVIDDIINNKGKSHELIQNWNFGDYKNIIKENKKIIIKTSKKNFVIKTDENCDINLFNTYRSLYYGEKTKLKKFNVKLTFNGFCRLFTLLYPDEYVDNVSLKTKYINFNYEGQIFEENFNEIGSNIILSRAASSNYR